MLYSGGVANTDSWCLSVCQTLYNNTFWRGQPPARHTKVVDDDLRPLKSGPPCLSVPVCANDAASPKPTTQGRDVADVHAQTTCGCVVSACGSVKHVDIFLKVVPSLVIM